MGGTFFVASERYTSAMALSRTQLLLLAVAGVVLVQVIVLHLLGQPAICSCGYVDLWHSAVLSSGNSQHLTDWYTFSHIIHGLIFYGILRFAFPRMGVLQRLVLATGIEAAWEIAENTPMVIDFYRQQALAQGYIGDSIINSVFDTLAMIGGFFLAYRLPVWGSVALGIGLEAFAGYWIHDGLALNLLNFVHQFDFISAWQSEV